MILHRLKYHKNEKADIVIPDFAVCADNALPQRCLKLFDNVYVFPYFEIPHNRKTISEDTEKAYRKVFGSVGIDRYDKIYVAGVHFYFTDFLLRKGIRFSCFEEAAGLYSNPGTLVRNVGLKFKVQKRWAAKNKLFTYSNPLIDEVFCYFKAQKKTPKNPKCVDFDPMACLEVLTADELMSVKAFFGAESYVGEKNAVILITEQFSNLAKMTEEQQKKLYRNIGMKLQEKYTLYIKPHPDDAIDYAALLPGAKLLDRRFPAELLPFVFCERPKYIATVSSTSIKNINGYFEPIKI